MQILLSISAFFISFILVVIITPSIVRVSKAKQLFDLQNERKIHKDAISHLGGVAIFIGFIISSIIATNNYSFLSLKYIIASVILVFFIGLKDDLMEISPGKKIVMEVLASILLTTLGNVRLSNMHGIFGIYEINYLAGVLISVFIIIVIVNAYNLIDGIDGLASGLVILAGSIFGIWFLISGHIQYAILAFALIGSLTAFFIFNVFGGKNKLFMGDAGSLIIGLIIAILAIKFNEFNIDRSNSFTFRMAPVLSFSILAVPLVDVIRVMTIRLINRKSPFFPDQNHIHHRLLPLHPKHIEVTTIILVVNVFIIGIAMLLINSPLDLSFQLLIILIIVLFLLQIPSIRIKIISKKNFKELNSITLTQLNTPFRITVKESSFSDSFTLENRERTMQKII